MFALQMYLKTKYYAKQSTIKRVVFKVILIFSRFSLAIHR